MAILAVDQKYADDIFEAALNARDEDALAAECQRRLETKVYGATITFRTGWNHPVAWREPLRADDEPNWAAQGRAAARALIAALEND